MAKLFRKFRKRIPTFVCPHCGSKLDIWRQKAKEYLKMEAADKSRFLDTLSNKEEFLRISARVIRKEPLCEFSNKYNDLSPESEKKPDLLVVSTIEKSLGRPLTELENQEGHIFYTDGENFSKIKLSENFSKFLIPRENNND
jgi:hypothetical protein